MDDKEAKIKSPSEVTLDEKSYAEKPEPAPESFRPEPPKPKKRISLGIMLAVLGLLLVGGALALGYLWGNNGSSNNSQCNSVNNSQAISDNEPNSSSQNQTGNNDGSSSESDTPSIAEVEKLLEKYIGEGNYIQAHSLNALYNTFSSKFDEKQKAFLTYHTIDSDEKEAITCTDQWYERGQCTGKSISYDLISEKYKSLFGDYGSIEKKNYAFHDFFYLVYDDSINAYREFILPGGGTTSIMAMRKIVAVEKSGKDIIATLTFATINTEVEDPSERSTVVREPGSSPVTMINLPSNTLDEIVNSMAIYEFTLSPYNDSYVLTAVNKTE